MRRACIVAIAVVAGCRPAEGTGPDGLGPQLPIDAGATELPPAIDAPADAAPDAAADASTDASPPDLTAICGAQPVTLDDWERCYLKRWCEWQVSCRALNTYPDVQACIDGSDQVEGGRLGAERRERARAVEQRRAAVDVAAFSRCLLDTSPALCNTARFSPACATRFTGTVGDGAACYTDIDCASPGATCDASCTDACCLGSCRPRFRQGEACDLGDSCEPGLVCHHTCMSGDIGRSCAGDRDCDPGAWCNAGICRADLAPGSSCTSSFQCGGDTTCVGLSITDSTPGLCLSTSTPGARCDFLCFGNLYCDGSGTCRELPGPGQTCSGLVPCRGFDLACTGGQCAPRSDAGAGCATRDTCRPGLFCTSELNEAKPACAAPRAEGQPCTDPGHCQSYLCSGTAGQPGTCLAWSDRCPAGGAPETAAGR